MRITHFSLVAASSIFVTTLSASIYQGGGFAVSSTVTGGIGYDSNLTFNSGSSGSAYASAKVFASVKRVNTVARTEFQAYLNQTNYFSSGFDAETNADARFIYQVPSGVGGLLGTSFLASWSRLASADPSVGQRVKNNLANISIERRFPLTGKFVIDPSLSWSSSSFSETNLDSSNTTRAELAFGYTPSEKLQLSLVGGGAWGKTSTERINLGDVTSKSASLLLRAEGELSSKLLGTVYFGAENLTFSGRYASTKTEPSGGADLTYSLRQGTQIILAGAIFNGFSAEGQAQMSRNVTLTVQQQLQSFVVLGAYIGSGKTNYSGIGTERNDDSISAGTTLAYRPSQVFSAGAGYRYTNQSSNNARFQYDRHLITATASYNF